MRAWVPSVKPGGVFLRWLLTTFPLEMREGWRLVQPDLLLWLALSSLVTVAAMSLPPPGVDQPPPVFPFLVSIVSGLLTSMLPAVLFTAQLERLELTWAPVLRLVLRKAAPLLGYAIVAMSIAYGADSLMIAAVSLALGDSPLLLPASTICGIVILVTILVRFSFLPFLVILHERADIPEKLWKWEKVEQAAPLFWPLTASARLTEGVRWRLVFYTLIGQVLPIATALVGSTPAKFPVSVAAMLVLTTVQAVLYGHYRRRAGELAIAAPVLPLEEDAEAT